MASKVKCARSGLCLSLLLWPAIANAGTTLCSTIVAGGTGPCAVGVPQNNANQPIGSALPVAPTPQPTIPVLITPVPPFTLTPAPPSQPISKWGNFWDKIGRGWSVISDGVYNLMFAPPYGSPDDSEPAAIVNQSPNPSLQCPYTAPINQTANTTIITNPGGKSIHVCGIVLVSATAQGVTVAEGTGTACATNPTYWDGGSGGTVQVSANGGYAVVSQRILYPMQVAGNNVCIIQSGAGNISGHINYGIFFR